MVKQKAAGEDASKSDELSLKNIPMKHTSSGGLNIDQDKVEMYLEEETKEETAAESEPTDVSATAEGEGEGDVSLGQSSEGQEESAADDSFNITVEEEDEDQVAFAELTKKEQDRLDPARLFRAKSLSETELRNVLFLHFPGIRRPPAQVLLATSPDILKIDFTKVRSSVVLLLMKDEESALRFMEKGLMYEGTKVTMLMYYDKQNYTKTGHAKLGVLYAIGAHQFLRRSDFARALKDYSFMWMRYRANTCMLAFASRHEALRAYKDFRTGLRIQSNTVYLRPYNFEINENKELEEMSTQVDFMLGELTKLKRRCMELEKFIRTNKDNIEEAVIEKYQDIFEAMKEEEEKAGEAGVELKQENGVDESDEQDAEIEAEEVS